MAKNRFAFALGVRKRPTCLQGFRAATARKRLCPILFTKLIERLNTAHIWKQVHSVNSRKRSTSGRNVPDMGAFADG